MEYSLGYCSICNRADVPICPACGKRVPHGFISGTWLPCSCGGMGEPLQQVIKNAELESNQRKEVKTDEK